MRKRSRQPKINYLGKVQKIRFTQVHKPIDSVVSGGGGDRFAAYTGHFLSPDSLDNGAFFGKNSVKEPEYIFLLKS